MIADLYETWSVSMKIVQLCKQGNRSFIPGKYLLGRFLGKSLHGIAGYKTSYFPVYKAEHFSWIHSMLDTNLRSSEQFRHEDPESA